VNLHLVDATYELFRAYFALPKESAPDGAEVGAIRGLIASMAGLLREPGVTHVAAATDHVVESFRNDLFAGYKTGAGMPADLYSQFPLAEDALRALGIVVWPMCEFEADDALATAAARYAADFARIVILSPDKDLAQCVRDDAVVTHDRRRGITYDAAGVVAKFGVPPASIPDWLALVGDSADGLPGIPGWGAKTAGTVLAAYGTIEAIPDDAAQWRVKVRGAERVARALAERRPEAGLYKQLATLRTDVPLAESAADLRWRGIDRDAVAALCRRCGLVELGARLSASLSSR
jgi:5'-3' exonuclease